MPARSLMRCMTSSKFGLLGKHPTTGAAIASPFVATSQSFGKQANAYWYGVLRLCATGTLGVAQNRGCLLVLIFV